MLLRRLATWWLPQLLALALVAWFWSEFRSSRALRREVSTVLASSHRPYIVNGLRIRLDQYLRKPLVRSSEYHLLLVTSDSCPYSRPQVQSLANMIWRGQSLPPTILVSLSDGSEAQRALVTALDAHGISHQDVRLTNSYAFSEDTGLVWTPAIALLDGDLRIRFVTERITPAAEAALVQAAARTQP